MENKNDKITKWCIWGVISFQTLLTAIFMIIQTLRLFITNGGYTRELTIKYLGEILVLIIIWVLVVLVGGVFSFIRKIDDKNVSKQSSLYKLNTLLLMIKDRNSEDCKELNKLILFRKIAWSVCAGICAICALFCFLYLFNEKHFISSGDAMTQCLEAFKYLAPFVIIGMASAIITTVYEIFNVRKSIEYAKLVLKTDRKAIELKNDSDKKKIIIWAIRGAILLVAVVLIITGIVDGGAKEVFKKAAGICFECIGLG